MHRCFLLAFLLFPASLALNCTRRDAFSDVRVLHYDGEDDGEKRATSSEDLRDAYRLEVVHQSIPALCEGSVSGFPRLDKLVLQDDGIEEVEAGAFRDLPVLRELRITYNRIGRVRNGVFDGLKVKFLNLQHNGITIIETGAFDNLPELQVLELDFNEIRELDPHWFTGSPNVRRLSMAENQLVDVPEASFRNMGANKVDVWLMGNKIATVHPKAFEGIERADHLWLYDNRIENLDDDLFEGVQSIEHLSLGGNRLRCVGDKFLENLRAKSINFDGNPLNCDCIEKIKRWAKENGVEHRFIISRLQCAVERARKVLEDVRDV